MAKALTTQPAKAACWDSIVAEAAAAIVTALTADHPFAEPADDVPLATVTTKSLLEEVSSW
jgi:hypothetical protein